MFDFTALSIAPFISPNMAGANRPSKSKCGNFLKNLVAPPHCCIIAYDKASCLANVFIENLMIAT